MVTTGMHRPHVNAHTRTHTHLHTHKHTYTHTHTRTHTHSPKLICKQTHSQGVIGVIVPWNYPFHNVLSATVAALMAGNGAVVKVCNCLLINVYRTVFINLQTQCVKKEKKKKKKNTNLSNKILYLKPAHQHI
jgi:hypothetical protein